MIKNIALIVLFLGFGNLQNEVTAGEIENDGLRELVNYLTHVNRYLQETKLETDFYTPASYTSFVSKYYGGRAGFEADVAHVHQLIEDNTKLLGLDKNLSEDMDQVLNHLLWSVDKRLAEFQGLEENNDCQRSYIIHHQECLNSAIIDGLFERMNASVGAAFLNCLSKASDKLFDCLN
jgi:hypothetical protein